MAGNLLLTILSQNNRFILSLIISILVTSTIMITITTMVVQVATSASIVEDEEEHHRQQCRHIYEQHIIRKAILEAMQHRLIPPLILPPIPQQSSK